MTTNEMIYKTIMTKLEKEPKYRSVLEDMGYEVYDSGKSAYGNWAVKNLGTERSVLVSRDYFGKRGLFNGYIPIKKGDPRKVDFVGYLRKEKTKNKVASRHREYRHLSDVIEDSKKLISTYEDCLNRCHENLDSWIKHYEERCAEYQKKIDEENARLAEARAKVDELRKGKREVG